MSKNRKIITARELLINHQETKKLFLPKEMDHFQLLRMIKKISKQIGLNDSLVRQYELMINYTNPIDWKVGNKCICWLSVERMAEELGKSVRQVQYNTDRLVELGLISMELSGNYRRGGQRDEMGRIIWASGVDLKPVILKIEAYQAMALELDMQDRKRSLLNKEISSLRRKMRSFFDYNSELEGLANAALEVIKIRPRLCWGIERLEELWNNLQSIWQEIITILSPDESENDHQNCIHGCNQLQTLYKDTIQSSDCYKEATGENAPLPHNEARGGTPHATSFPPSIGDRRMAQNSGMPCSLAQFMQVQIEQAEMHSNDDYGRYRKSTWNRTAQIAAEMGIHKTAIADSVGVFGYRKTSELIAKIHERVCSKTKPIKCPGGYLRYLVQHPDKA